MRVICTEGGLQGNYSNHSGKRTCATQLYMSGVEEQQIMARTGHRSQAGVRKYKRCSAEMDASVSNVLDPPIVVTEKSIECGSNIAVEREDDSVEDLRTTCTGNSDAEGRSVGKKMRPNGYPLGEFNNCNITFQF